MSGKIIELVSQARRLYSLIASFVDDQQSQAETLRVMEILPKPYLLWGHAYIIAGVINLGP
jgi:hypothetical protein